MDWVGNEGVDINWNVSPVSSPVTVLSHRGEFNKVPCKHVGLSIGFPQETPARLEQHVEATAGDKLAKPLGAGGGGRGSSQGKFGRGVPLKPSKPDTLFTTNILLLFCIQNSVFFFQTNIMELIFLEKLLAPNRLLICSLHTLINWTQTHSVKVAKYCNCISF